MKFVEANKQKNNRGMALVSVLIVITLIGLLGSSILNLSYLAYQRKLVEKKNTENFYAAEAVIDTVKASLQNTAATALSSASDGTSAFASAAYKAVVGTDSTSADADTYEANVKNELYYAIIETSTDVAAAISTEGVAVTDSDGDVIIDDEGNTVYGNGGEFSIGDIVVESDCLRIEDVHVKYVNDEGYTSEITTDIVINAPVYASDEVLPVGTYSMFAGNGALIYAVGAGYEYDNGYFRQMHQALYYHQEGNVYMGSMSNDSAEGSTTSLIIGEVSEDEDTINAQKGMTFMSIGGENVVFNGDVIVSNGNTLIFTGGDGSETTNIQVNGYIVLEEGATLLFTPNCNIVCKGIVTSISYDSDGNLLSYEPYTGTDQADDYGTISQFYPFTEKYVTDNVSNASYSSFNDGDLDVEMLLNEVDPHSIYVSSKAYDSRYYTVSKASSGYGAGVYILDVKTSSDDGTWCERANDAYYLVKSSVSGTTGNTTWTFTSECTKYAGNIVCSESDTKLKREEKIYYNGEWYDAEFAEIVNVPLFSRMTQTIGVPTNLVDNYESAVIDKVKFKKSVLTGIFTGDETWINNNFTWEDDIEGTDFETRDFKVLSNSTSLTYTGYVKSVVDEYGDTYTMKNTQPSTEFGITDSNTTAGSAGNVYFWVSNNTEDMHLEGGSHLASLFMSAKLVKFSPSRGYVRGISLVELADSLDGYNGLSDANNPVRQYLETIATGVLYGSGSLDSLTAKTKNEYSFFLVDNLFNGGISVFWNRSASSSSSSSSSAEDNSSINFIDTENWSKD